MDNAIYPAQITVKETKRGDGQYPKLTVTTADGKDFNINDKHKDLWPVFENAVGKTVILIWKHPPEGVTWKSYIEKAQVMITAANVQQLQQPIQQPVQSASKPVAPVAAPIPQTNNRDDLISAQVAYKGVVELIDAGKISIDTKLGMRAQAWALLAFDAVLPKATIEFIDSRIEATKETKPKAVK